VSKRPPTGVRTTRTPADSSSPALSEALRAVVELSRRFGLDPEFSRAGGGNSSAKADGVLYIKPSGTPLTELTVEALVGLELRPLIELLEAPEQPGSAGGTDEVMRVAVASRVGPDDGRRPSVELLFHALLPQRYVLHTHPIAVNAVTCSSRGRELATELFGDRVLWIPYTNPGLPLARRIRDARREHEGRVGAPAPAALLLQNHGLVVAADSPAEIDRVSGWIVDAIRDRLGGAQVPATPDQGTGLTLDPAVASAAVRVIGPVLRAALSDGERLDVVTFDDGPLARRVEDPATGAELIAGGPLTPDQIVYAGSRPLVLDPIEATADADALAASVLAAVERFEGDKGYRPAAVVVPNLGLFAAGASIRQAETVRDVYLDSVRVATLAARLGGIHPLADQEREFIERWEAEEYRRRVAAGSARPGRVEGLVAVVTGAAQGFGLSIASDLVAQGAHVVLADVNAALAGAEADSLAAQFGAGRAVGLPIDVTDDVSVATCFDAVVRRYGGFDLLVSNAGILRAGSVATQPVAEFDAVTRVNYRGYFLCVRYAAPILARQHRARPDYWADIVEINSKSGLAGSSRNSAYAGSKFGGIGLTQSFALELVGDGIKVNAICPGNFLEGPLWSDPANGLFVQYLREGKVSGARTIGDVRRAYEAKVPMGRGCTPADVMEAIYYVIAQRYETGQAIPVTGGQVMLS
jgi:rhamnose utilization protein RhaD (predicted bifunctional aldolase and dehydrogenase)/NAD(P)-dependent dehydrogenase (short-subunit alcohol dehydrogenase family)